MYAQRLLKIFVKHNICTMHGVVIFHNNYCMFNVYTNYVQRLLDEILTHVKLMHDALLTYLQRMYKLFNKC